MNIDKNKFELYNENETLKNISLDECVDYANKNNYKGFIHNNDRNICFINKEDKLQLKIDDKFKDYKNKTYKKIKNTIDLNPDQDQNNPYHYFEENNNKQFISKKNIQYSNISNIENCMNYCINDYDNSCKSITYLENPTYCTFYNNIKSKTNNEDNDNYDYDTYTLKKNMNYTQKNRKDKKKIDLETKEEETEEGSPLLLYNCDGIYSTNPFCTKEYTDSDLEIYEKEKNQREKQNYSDCFSIDKINTVQEETELYNSQCKKKFGNDYEYTNDKIPCDSNQVRIKCKVNFLNDSIIDYSVLNNDKKIVEHFEKDAENKYDSNFTFKIFIFVIILFVLFLIMYIL
jgi:hypothetical protein